RDTAMGYTANPTTNKLTPPYVIIAAAATTAKTARLAPIVFFIHCAIRSADFVYCISFPKITPSIKTKNLEVKITVNTLITIYKKIYITYHNNFNQGNCTNYETCNCNNNSANNSSNNNIYTLHHKINK